MAIPPIRITKQGISPRLAFSELVFLDPRGLDPRGRNFDILLCLTAQRRGLAKKLVERTH